MANDNASHANALVSKALKDPSFKDELLKNSNAAVEKSAGVKIPAGMTVKVVQDTATLVHLVLPMTVTAAKGELSDADLLQVSGGAGASTQVKMCQDSSSHPTICVA